MTLRDERNWGTFIHLGGIVGAAIFQPAGNIILVLILWLIKRNESRFVDDQGKEAINFQITISLIGVLISLLGGIFEGLWSFGSWVLSGGGGYYFHGGWGWGKLHGVLWIVNVIFSIIAAVKANEGTTYRYPISLRLVK
ncbi:DUF4870 domain-containing protein [Chitinophaga qingshengii]|uniref:DUF4870 domain-containing protein n=1 Tax=Chitinophaga qingshengii TaxID=1569794 RepID=A0ABR7TFY6_9BACT|nr:DUF4870 domain-containing protein [Chitinophaga qingshengii]MBC9928815.1 DUF4870 domain-containing protein [Chitinophaga qingshengii]